MRDAVVSVAVARAFRRIEAHWERPGDRLVEGSSEIACPDGPMLVHPQIRVLIPVAKGDYGLRDVLGIRRVRPVRIFEELPDGGMIIARTAGKGTGYVGLGGGSVYSPLDDP